jgi:hypothetical protein
MNYSLNLKKKKNLNYNYMCKCDKRYNKCNKNCENEGEECIIDFDCKEKKNNFTIKEYTILVKNNKKYKIDYNNDILQSGGSNNLERDKILKDVSNWSSEKLPDDHELPKDLYYDLYLKYGKPYILVNKIKGIAIWNKDQLKKKAIEEEVILRDERVKHCVPAVHYDFLTSYIKVYVPSKNLPDVMAVSGSVTYDGLKKLLSARCGSLQANYATFRTCLKIIDNDKENYSNNINNKIEDEVSNLDFIKDFLKNNKMVYKKELNDEYYEYAFPNGCN